MRNTALTLHSITIEFAEQFKQLEIADVTGKILLRKTLSKQRGTIDISTFAKGMYFIRFSNGNTTISRKFVKD